VFKIYVQEDMVSEEEKSLFCDYPYLTEDAYEGQIIQIDSGLFQVEVLEFTQDYVLVEAKNDALIGSRRHINLPGVKLKLPGVTEKDKTDVLFGIEVGMDFIAMSFVRNKENIAELREILKENNASQMKIISKIENEEGIENISEIIDASDGIMVARGDLGIEVPIEKLPMYQSNIVKETLKAGKFTIIATHMLESMIDNPFPTRAEVSDIYNSVMQKTDCTMLSGETATGKYPILAVKTMAETIREAEGNKNFSHDDFSNTGLNSRDIEKKALIRSAIYSGEELGVQALFIFTKSGLLARIAASYRPNIPIYSFTLRDSSLRYMNALFGVYPNLITNWDENFAANIDSAIEISKEKKYLKSGDRVMVVNDIKKNDKEIPLIQIVDIE